MYGMYDMYGIYGNHHHHHHTHNPCSNFDQKDAKGCTRNYKGKFCQITMSLSFIKTSMPKLILSIV